MEISNRIWEEMKQAKVNALCLQHYTDDARKRMRWANWVIVFISAAGTLLYGIFPVGTFIATTLVALFGFVKNIAPIFTQSDEELYKLDCLMAFYNSFFNDLELLWIQFRNENITDKEAATQFHRLKKKETEKLPELNRYVRSLSEKEEKVLQNESDEYLTKIYYPNGE